MVDQIRHYECRCLSYLGVSAPSQHVDHHLHDGLMHAQGSHQVRVLVENLVVHDVPDKEQNHNHNHNKNKLELEGQLQLEVKLEVGLEEHNRRII